MSQVDQRSINETQHCPIGRARSRSDPTLTSEHNRNVAAIPDTLLLSVPSHELLSPLPRLSTPSGEEFGITITTLLSTTGSNEELHTDNDSQTSIATAIPVQSTSVNDDRPASLEPVFDPIETAPRASSTLNAEEMSNYAPPPKFDLILYSRRPHTRGNRYIISLTVLSTMMICMSTYYAYNSSIAPNPFLRLLWGSSDWTVLTINVLMQASVILLFSLTNAVSDNLRWSKACSSNGISFLGFLALSPSASPMALFSLIKCTHRNRDQSEWYWAVQRCFSLSCIALMYSILISLLLFLMSCLLLLNMSIQQSCISNTMKSFSIMAGVRPFNETPLFTTDAIAIQALSYLAVTGRNFGLPGYFVRLSPEISSYYLLEQFPNWEPSLDGAIRINKEGFLKVPSTPIYNVFIHVNVSVTWPQVDCRTYQYSIFNLMICAQDYFVMDLNENLTLFGKSLLRQRSNCVKSWL